MITFPDGFSLSANEKHFSNIDESIKYFKEIKISNVEKKRRGSDRINQDALLIWDVFREIYECISNNMTSYYQLLNFTTNKWAGEFKKNKFSTWYIEELRREFKNVTAIKDISIKFP